MLTPIEGGQRLAAYGASYYKGEAALVEKKLGKGRVLHWGSVFTKDNALPLLTCAGVKPLFADIVHAPELVEMVLREKDGQRYLFLLNYQPTEAAVTLDIPAKSLYTGETLQGEIVLPPFGTLALRL